MSLMREKFEWYWANNSEGMVSADEMPELRKKTELYGDGYLYELTALNEAWMAWKAALAAIPGANDILTGKAIVVPVLPSNTILDAGERSLYTAAWESDRHEVMHIYEAMTAATPYKVKA